MILLFFCELIAATSLLTSKKIIKARTLSPEMPSKNDISRDYHLFEQILNNIRHANPDSYSTAQQQFITSLCTLAYKIEGKPEDLDLHKVLNVWKIPLLN